MTIQYNIKMYFYTLCYIMLYTVQLCLNILWSWMMVILMYFEDGFLLFEPKGSNTAIKNYMLFSLSVRQQNIYI